MAERELRHMSRTELIEIIYAELEQQLADRTLRLEKAGSIAEAALALNHVFEDAQAAADAYLSSVKAMNPGVQPQKTPLPADNGGADVK